MKFSKIILPVFILVLFTNSFVFSADRNTLSEKNSVIEKVAVDKDHNEDLSEFKTVKADKPKKYKLKRKQRRLIRKMLKEDPLLTDDLLLVILAILLPPLAVFLVDGIGNLFWIDLILTILGWLPGVIFALWVILK